MEIEWGTFYFQCEKTVAVLIAAAPIVIVMQLPTTLKFVRWLVFKGKEAKNKKLGRYGI